MSVDAPTPSPRSRDGSLHQVSIADTRSRSERNGLGRRWSSRDSLQLRGEFGDANGLLYLRARWYEPVAAIFLSRDPASGQAERPTSLNVFIYASRQPTLLVDPSGLDPSGSSLTVPRYALPDYVRVASSVDPFGLGWGAAVQVTIVRYGNVYWQPGSGLFVGLTRKSALPASVTVTAGCLVQVGVPSEGDLASFISGYTTSGCASWFAAVCGTLSPLADGAKYATEVGLGWSIVDFSGGIGSAPLFKVPTRW